MAKAKDRTDSSITKVNPEFLSAYVDDDTSLDALKEHRVVPRIKLIQGTSDQALKKLFGEGTAVLRPGDVEICRFEDDPSSFQIVPVLFFVEYAKWGDLNDNAGPMVVERSFDPACDLAKRAKDVETREELYSGQENVPEKDQMHYRYVEHLRFICLIYGEHPLAGTPVTISFERGEYGQGKNFISAISLRRQKINETPTQVPLWAQVWELSPGFRCPDKSRKWYGFDFIAAQEPLIQADEAASMKALHLEMKELFEKERLIVDDEPIDGTKTPPEDTGAY